MSSASLLAEKYITDLTDRGQKFGGIGDGMSKKATIVIAGVLVVAGVVSAGVYYWNKKKKQKTA